MMDELEKTIELLRANFSIKEVSTETNPNHLTPHNLKRLKEMGVNRLSVGVQTFDDEILKAIGRFYKSGSGDEIAERLKETEGIFDTLNADMIFNFPTQTVKTLERDLSILNQIKIGQVTYYPLMYLTMRLRPWLKPWARLTTRG
jgi:coproporphyrinogen III oxidase-like Fe-S oxidoreductase